MKKMILKHMVQAVLTCMALSACGTRTEVDPPAAASRLSFWVLNTEVVTRDLAPSNDRNAERLIFTGDDILWFNASTREIMFKNNIEQRNVMQGVMNKSIGIYIDGEYLFSSMNCVSSLNSQIFDNLVLYYNMIENRFFLNDGYPELSAASEGLDAQHFLIRQENAEKIKSEWDIFIRQLKVEGRYKNS